MNLLEESVSDNLEHLETSKDSDAKVGHKTADTSFLGYKTHIAMTEERIITAVAITSGEKTDGKELPALVRKSREAGMEVETVIGDKAYSDKKNIEAAKDGEYELVARLNSIITCGVCRVDVTGGEIVQKTRDFRELEQFGKIVSALGFFVCCIVRKHIHCFLDGIAPLTG